MAGSLVTIGVVEICKLLIGEVAGIHLYDNANSSLGVGDDNTPTTVGMIDLQAATNRTYNPMFDGTYPQRTGATITWKAKFLTTEANYDWNEVAVFNGDSKMLDRDVVSFGTKPGTQEWHLIHELTLSAS